MPQFSQTYSLVIFGATGFVGSILCQYLLEQLGVNGPIQWAIAGRSKARLDALATKLGPKAKDIPPLVANVSEESSLLDLCTQTQVVISTVGPYALYGESLVKACAETGTDYCDITGEPQWIRQMIQRYAATAQNSGARILHCCGFDSIPSDLGVYYLQMQAQQQFGQPCNRIKMRVKAAQGGISGGTAASGINIVKEASANPDLRQELNNSYSLCPERGSQHSPMLIPVQYDPDFNSWASPFVMAAINTRIVLRPNALFDYAYGQAFQYDEAILTGAGTGGWLVAQGLGLGLGGIAAAMAFSPSRWLLEHTLIPKPGDGPSPDAQEQGFYDLRCWGTTAEQQTIQVKVTGDRDPGYGSTARILAQAGLCLAQDCPKSSKAGGFWTPATALGDALIQRLEQAAGLTFEVY